MTVIIPIILLCQGGWKYVVFGLILLLGNNIIELIMFPIHFLYLLKWKSIKKISIFNKVPIKIVAAYIITWHLFLYTIYVFISILIFNYVLQQDLTKYYLLPLWSYCCIGLLPMLPPRSKTERKFLETFILSSFIVGIMLVFNNTISINVIILIFVIPALLFWMMQVILFIYSPKKRKDAIEMFNTFRDLTDKKFYEIKWQNNLEL